MGLAFRSHAAQLSNQCVGLTLVDGIHLLRGRVGEDLEQARVHPIHDRLRHDYGLRTTVLELATLVHPDSLRGVTPPPRRADETPAMADCAHEFERILRLRTLLHSSP